ncbi:hypothetical protein [Pontibacter sp. 172403-2]|uniref:hypothetical protein n=1 Tax=Pontibacter rufus TaxID=2791028 RepID=UPI0018AFD724|nr:hypothetical protein [Pontibacter sp. 172403-2]
MRNPHSYEAYRSEMGELVRQQKTTGPEQTEEQIGYTKLDLQGLKRVEKQLVPFALKRNWLLVALANLVVVACLGLLLRWMFVAPIAAINYKFLLHGHSHVALLGWLYSALFVALLYAYLPPEVQRKKVYARQFWLSQGAVAGMLVSFPLQGYALFSITFSTLHILLSYWFIYQFLRDAKDLNLSQGPHGFSFKFIRAALFFLGLSTLGPWAMGPIMATGHIGDSLYFNAIYFYLHFQYNGWFTFAVLGLLCWLLEKYDLRFNRKPALAFFRWMFWSCLPAYVLSVLWTKPAAILYIVGGAAAFGQVVGLVLLVRLLYPLRKSFFGLFDNWSRGALLLSALAFILKILMQFSTAFPYMADLAYRQRNFVIGYLHLVLLGFVSLIVFAFFAQRGWLNFKSSMSRWGSSLFLIGLIGSEALLFLQGVLYWAGAGMLPHYFGLLFSISIALPLGILLFFAAQFLRRKSITRQPKAISELQHSEV